MAYVTLKTLFKSCTGRNAIGAFNVHNIEFIKGVVAAAERTGKPTIMMINEAVLLYSSIEILAGAAVAAAQKASVDMAVMVDHGTHIDFLKECLDYGIDIMYDGSALPYEENIANTHMLADYAHARGLSIEGEIGVLGISEDGDVESEQCMTTVPQALDFSSRTDVDVLAVSVGNSHGFYMGEAKINVDRIREISTAVTPLPVVMHGGSDIPYKTIRNSILAGIKKFNIATDLKQAYAVMMNELMTQDPLPIQPLKIFPAAAEAVAAVAEQKIRDFNLERDA